MNDETNMDLMQLLFTVSAEKNAVWRERASDLAGVIMEQNDQVKALNDILSHMDEGNILSESELDTLVDMGIITESERPDCNDPGRRDAIARRIEKRLKELDGAIQLNVLKFQGMLGRDDITTDLIISIMNGGKEFIMNMRSSPKYACEDENGNVMFFDVEYGEHTFAVFDEKGGWVAGVKLRLENDPSRPASTEWVQDANGVWVFNAGGYSPVILAGIALNNGTDGTKSVAFTGGTALKLPDSPPAVWPYIAGGAVLLLGAAAVLFFCLKHGRKPISAPARRQ